MKPQLSSLMLSLALAAGSSLAVAETTAPAPATKAEQAQPRMGMGDGPRAGKRHAGRPMMREKQESFTEESTRKMADGRVFKRQLEQKVGEGSFYRKEVMTNPDGKTASRTVTATLDKDKKTWTRKIEGVDFDGSTWSRTQDSPAPHDADDDAGQDDKPAAPEKKAAGGKKAK
ncbi:MAG: hypothetical protein K0S46_1817 [Moraxellaceae bacterium]|jgi:hypothetical protein|nr:hypothetical protein [Moraxellaceae bacterium]